MTRRIVAISDGAATTRSDATRELDPAPVQLSRSAYSRVWLGIPWIGYPFVVDGGWVLLAMIAAAALALALRAGWRQPELVAGPARSRLPVA